MQNTMDYKLQQLLWILAISAVSSAWTRDSSMIRLRNLLKSEAPKTRPSFIPKIPEHCRDQGVCSDVPNYPQEYIDQLLQRNSTASNALNFLLRNYDTPNGCQSNKREPNDYELCASKIKLILAKAGQDSNGNWRFLVGEHWLCVEICENAGQSCSLAGIHIMTGYNATCIQKHISKRAIGIDENGDMGYLEIKVNSACCCHVTHNPESVLQNILAKPRV